MLRNPTSRLLAVCLIVFVALTSLVAPGAAQETSTETLTPTPTLTPSLTPTHTETAVVKVTEEPVAEQTAEVIPTDASGDEPTAEVTPEVDVTAEGTEAPIATATSPESAATVDVPTPATPTAEALPPEPPLTPIFTENFDGGPSMIWTLGQGWSYVAHGDGLALQGTVSGEPVTFANSDILDAAVEMQFRLQAGTAQLSSRVSEAGAYAVQVDADGEVRLLRGDAVLRTATMAAIDPDTRHSLRLATFGDVLWVTLDGTLVMTVRDPQPLPAGTVRVAELESVSG